MEQAVEAVFRQESGRALATLIRLLGDFELAEDALQDAFAAALTTWSKTGLPGQPRAWLVQVARNRAIDRVRRRRLAGDKERLVVPSEAAESGDPSQELEDDLLRLIFTCCHPALAMEARVALTLRTVCGLPTASVARAFMTSETTMAQRLVRAKAKIRDARIPYRVPDLDVLPERLDGVLAVIYLVFNEGYAASQGETLMRPQLCEEAIRLARMIAVLLPGQPGVPGLLALMILHHARRDAREDSYGDIVRLEDQDRGLWRQDEIAEGQALVETALKMRGLPDTYAVQAAIAALHAGAKTFEQTDWRQIVGLYEVLMRLSDSPVAELNRAAALSMVEGPARALDCVDALSARAALSSYWLLPATRADLLWRLGRHEEAIAAFNEAIALVRLSPERRLLERRRALVGKDQYLATTTAGAAQSNL